MLAKRASDLHKQLGGALYVPPPKRDYFTNVPQFTVPDVRSSSGGGGGHAVWVILGVLVLFVRIIASGSSSSSSSRYDYDYKIPDIPKIDYDALSRLNNYSATYNPSAYSSLVPPAPDDFDPKADSATLWSQLDVSISAMFYPGVATMEQTEQMRALEGARLVEDCPQIRDALAKLEELPASTLRHGDEGDKHIRAMRERVDVLCPDKKAPKKKVRKKKSAHRKPPIDEAAETAEQP